MCISLRVSTICFLLQIQGIKGFKLKVMVTGLVVVIDLSNVLLHILPSLYIHVYIYSKIFCGRSYKGRAVQCSSAGLLVQSLHGCCVPNVKKGSPYLEIESLQTFWLVTLMPLSCNPNIVLMDSLHGIESIGSLFNFYTFDFVV